MDFCKYHPLAGATYFCAKCGIKLCDKCVDDDQTSRSSRCILCGSELESLGSANNVEPFWRRLPESFKYPLNSSSMSLIVLTSVLSVLSILMPFLLMLSVVMYLFAAGSILKYSFTCLERTALGEMKAPDVMDAYHGGIKLLFKLMAVTAVLSMLVVAAGYYLGTGFGGLLLVVIVISYPAILIRFAQTENTLEAMNPFSAIALITAIGLPYGLLMAFILIMMSSVGVLHEIIGKMFPAMSYLLQSIVSNYYMVVVFHIMGYMLFQFQGKLGYTARDDDRTVKSDSENLLARIDVLFKEGEYEQVIKLYYQAFKQFPMEAVFFDRYFDLLYASKKPELMADFGTDYLLFLIKKKRFDKITIAYKQILVIAPNFLPLVAEVRLQVAELLKRQGDVKLTINLLNGMHKIFPDYSRLEDAYLLLAETLGDIPAMQLQAAKCRAWVDQYRVKKLELAVRAEQKNNMVEERQLNLPPTLAGTQKSQRIGGPEKPKPSLVLELVPIEPIKREGGAE